MPHNPGLRQPAPFRAARFLLPSQWFGLASDTGMSLLGALLLDSLLEKQMAQDVYLAIRNDGVTGAGTWDNPYDASSTKFDDIMKDVNRVPNGATVRLGPGTFDTTGYPAPSGWSPVVTSSPSRSTLRIVGAGMGATTLRLIGVAESTNRHAIGMDPAGSQMNGFEISDLTIDCNFSNNSASNSSSGGISVHGKSLWLRRVRVINFGSTAASPGTYFSALSAAEVGSENCVVEECVVESPGVGQLGTYHLIRFGGTYASPHRLCVVRNCALRASDEFQTPALLSSLYAAINPGAGAGTTIEGNRIANCRIGVGQIPAGFATVDLLVRENYMRNVNKGFFGEMTGAPAIGRLVVLDNFIEVGFLETTTGLTEPTGVELKASSSYQANKLAIRKNVIRDAAAPAGTTSGIWGIRPGGCYFSIIENNIVNNIETDHAIVYTNCIYVKLFNNQTSSGTLLRGRDSVTSEFRQELQDYAEDSLLAF